MRSLTLALLSMLLAACAAAPVATQHDPRYLDDHLFAAPSEHVSATDVFALNDEMRRYLKDEIDARARLIGRQVALIDALYSKTKLKLEYDSTMTRNAAQAFTARSGNCLSLVIMTAALAKELGLNVSYQKVIVDDAIAHDGDIFLSIGHVNLTLGKPHTDQLGYGYRTGKKAVETDWMMVDFLPPDEMRSMRTRTIGEDVIVAMYMNNRAVEALALGKVEDAYWWAREAVVQAPDFLTSYNTLGVVYQRHRNPQQAERVLRHVLAGDPGNTLAMSNLVAVLADQGRVDESRQLAATLNRIDPEPAFSWYIRGMAAMRKGDLATAKEAFAKEVARAPDYHEFHFWLAIAHLGLGESDDARAHLALALKNSTTRRDHDLYAAKLDRLRQVH